MIACVGRGDCGGATVCVFLWCLCAPVIASVSDGGQVFEVLLLWSCQSLAT